MAYVSRHKPRRQVGGPKVPTDFADVHHVVAGWLQDARDRQEAARRSGQPVPGLPEASDLGGRRLLFTSALLTELEVAGWRLLSTTPITFDIRGESLSFSFHYPLRKRRVPLTRAERKLPENIATGRDWKLALVDTDDLALMVQAGPNGRRHQWSDHSGYRIEDQLGDILRRAEDIAQAEIDSRAERDEWRRESELREARRARGRRREAKLNRRWQDLTRLADDWDRAEQLRRFADAMERRAASEGEPSWRVFSVLSWVRSEADLLEPGSADLLALALKPRPAARDDDYGGPGF